MINRSMAVAMASAVTLCACYAADGNWLQSEIDSVAAAGGGVVRVGPGEREFRPIVLKSGVTLRLEKGAVLLASTNVADYAVRDGSPVLIGAFDAKDVVIEGEGVVDGRGWAFKEKEGLAGESQPVATPVLMSVVTNTSETLTAGEVMSSTLPSIPPWL